MVKSQRNYILYVQKNELSSDENGQIQNLGSIGVDATAYLTVKLPFTVEFDINKKTYSSCSQATIRIYNLSENHRNLIRKSDQDFWDLRRVFLQAGYNDQYATVFTGTIMRAYSVREGVNFVTTIEAQDLGFSFANSQASISIGASEEFASIIRKVATSSLPGVVIGTIGNLGPEATSRGGAYVGDGATILRQLTGEGFFVDNGVLNVLKTDECLVGVLPKIDSSNGLLGTPVLEKNILSFDMIFEPRIKMGQQLELTSRTAKNFNGLYKVIGLSHSVEISAAECGDAITSLELYHSGLLEVVG